MEIGERIEARRKELGMTQEELAKKLGYKSRSSINKIEAGVNELTQKKISAIATALQTTPEYIMGWDELLGPLSVADEGIVKICNHIYEACPELAAIEKVLSINDGDEFELITKFRDLDDEDKKMVLNFLETILMKDKYKKPNVEGGEVV